MELCPIAFWKKFRSDSFAIDDLTYEQFDALISRLAASIDKIESPIIAFVPQRSVMDVAFFFAAWRRKKSIYPLSHRLPEEALQQRITLTGATFLNPSPASIPHPSDDLLPDVLATLIETSSGSKIACHTLRALFAGATEANKALKIDEETSYCLNLPLYHISGIAIILRTFLAGAHLVFDPSLATHISMVPTQLIRLKEPLPQCKCLLIGGAPLGKAAYQSAIEKGLPLYLTYGMTETASMAAVKAPHSQMTLLPHIELKLGDEREILLRGTSLFEGYFGMEKHEGWFATRDLGRFENGDLLIVGRKDRQFISGGENIQPEEIEAALREVPEVLDARVTPSECEEFGEVPTAEIYAQAPVDLQEIKRQLEEHLPRFKIPKKFKVSKEPLKSSKMAEESLRNGH